MISSAVKQSLVDRGDVLEDLVRYLRMAWESFDRPRPSEPVVDSDLLRRLVRDLPQEGSATSAALDDAVHILDASVSPARPLYLAYIGSSGLETGVLAAALTSAYDANLATAAGAADLLDRQAVRWAGQFIGFPVAEGHFTSGGQISNLTAVLAAREHALPGTRENGVAAREVALYGSAEAHHSIARAVEAAGLGRRCLRRIAVDARHRMDPAVLAAALQEDAQRGVTPIAVIATAGTTLTGAVDPLDAIAEVCSQHDVWLHVDGAYGVPAAATATAGHWFRGLERADSVTMDAHKWLGVPKSCSLILMRETGHLRAAFGHQETYMLHEGDTANAVDHTLEYSRPFNSLKLWLALRVHGAEQYRSWLEGTLDNANLLAATVRARPDFTLLNTPMLSTVCFQHNPPGLPADQLNEHNERLAHAMQRDGRVYIAPALVDGRTCLRACFVNYRTTAESVDLVLEVAAQLGRSPDPKC
jgi:aromatic-L-amino-acid decarboxylase